MERTMSTPAYVIAKRHELLNSMLLQGQTGAKPAKSLSCDVVFGSPNLGCRGTGICKLNANDGVKAAIAQQSCKSASGLLISEKDGTGLALLIPREFLCINILRSQFRHGVFKMESPCRIPKSMVTALGLHCSHLAPGNYPVQQLDGYFRIDFKTF